jgi:hypothetical protein
MNMNNIKNWLRVALAYTILHPMLWDCAAALVAFVSLNQGWFKPWLPVGCLLYLLVRVWLLRGELKRVIH